MSITVSFLRAAACIAIGLMLAASAQGDADDLQARLQSQFGDTRLMVCFQGKGSCLPYDQGVVDEAYRRIPALGDRQVIVGGNSSGSIMAAYYSCFGFSDKSVAYANYRLIHGDKDAIRQMEQPASKLAKLLTNRPTELDYSVLHEYIGFALGIEDWKTAGSIDEIVRRSKCKPQFPVLIVAANMEVLDNRMPGDQLASRNHKTIDLSNCDVSWKEDVFASYQQNPDQFKKDYPDLVLGSDRRIGKAMTYFVDQSMFDLLSQIPPEERLADLRLMTTAQDVATAILASASEPSYFYPIVEREPAKLLTGTELGDLGLSRRRSYCGGYLMPMMAQDVRRMAPAIRVLGTGWVRNPQIVRGVLKTWYLADVQHLARVTGWWADMEVNPDMALSKRMIDRDLTSQEEFDHGKGQAAACFDADQGLPEFVAHPAFDRPATAAIIPVGDAGETPGDVTSGQPEPLATLRGLGPLLESGNEAAK